MTKKGTSQNTEEDYSIKTTAGEHKTPDGYISNTMKRDRINYTTPITDKRSIHIPQNERLMSLTPNGVDEKSLVTLRSDKRAGKSNSESTGEKSHLLKYANQTSITTVTEKSA